MLVQLHEEAPAALIDHESAQEHMPGTKVVEAFNFGLKHLKTKFDIICKFEYNFRDYNPFKFLIKTTNNAINATNT